MNEENLISIINKDNININDFIETFGEDGVSYVKEFCHENSHILKELRENECMKIISEKFGNNIDLAKSIYNFYIESKLKNVMIDNLKDEINEKQEEIKIYKEHMNDKEERVSKAIKNLYDTRISTKSSKPRLRMIRDQ